MPRTIGSIASWAYGRLNRPDLSSFAIETAWAVYLMVCNKVRFSELQFTSSEIPCVTNQSDYDLSSLVTNPAIRAISSIRLSISSTSKRRLRKNSARTFDSIYMVPGVPASYARWGNKIIFNPTPNSTTYTFRIRYWGIPTVATPTEDTTILTPEAWDELYKYETLSRLHIHLEEYDKSAYLHMTKVNPTYPSPKKELVDEIGIIPRLWNDLLMTTTEAEIDDDDYSVNPIVRPYNA